MILGALFASWTKQFLPTSTCTLACTNRQPALYLEMEFGSGERSGWFLLSPVDGEFAQGAHVR